MNLHTPRSYQSSLNKSTEKMTKRQDKATIGLGSDKNQEVYTANEVKVVNTVNLVSGAFQQPGQPC